MSLRVVAAARGAGGLATLLVPGAVARLLGDATPQPPHPVLRLLGARHAGEAVLVFARPTAGTAALSVAVDATHVVTCLVLAGVSPRHRRAALRDAAYELVLMAATAAAAPRRRETWGARTQPRWQVEAGDGPHLVLPVGGSAPAGSHATRGLQHVVPLRPGALLIGRATDADVRLTDPTVSPRHAQVVLTEDGRAELVDLGSSNGTLVNGLPVRRAVLHSGDRIELGASTVVYVATGDEEGADR